MMSTVAGPELASPEGGLRRVLGLGFNLAVVVGGTVGVGILRTPGEIASMLVVPGLILGIWALGGFYVLLGSLCVSELGTMLPRAGGFYVYVRRALGDGVGTLIGLTDWLGQSAAVAWAAVTMVEFAALLSPQVAAFRQAAALAIILGAGLVQWRGVRAASGTQNWTTVVKALAFAALLLACFLAPAQSAGQPAPPPLWSPAVAFCLALQSVIVTYDGWYCAIYFTEEDRDTAGNLPRAMLGGTLAVIALYLLVNVALLRVLGAAGLAGSKQPAADAVARIAGAATGRLVTALSLISLVPLINAILMCSSRILFGLSRDRLVTGALSAVNPRGTPVALWPTVLVAAVLAATGTFARLVAIAGFLFVVNHCASFIALMVLRAREPGAPRPFRVPWYPWVPLAALGGGVSYLAGALLGDSRNSIVALALVLAGYPVYRLVRLTLPGA